MKSLPHWLACFFLTLFSAASHAYVGPPFLIPTQPIAGQPVEVRIPAGECDGFIDGVPGFPQIERNGTSIRLLVRGNYNSDPILCNHPDVVLRTTTGAFAQGHYTLQVDRFYAGLEEPTTETIGILNFDVVAPATVPAGGVVSGCLLALLLIATTRIFRGKKLLLVVVAGCLGENTERAWADTNQYVEVLLSSAAGAPSDQSIVQYTQTSPPPGGPPPLQAFAAVAPLQVTYLLPKRSHGDFASYLAANKDSPRGKLERYLLIEYAGAENMDSVMTSLQGDPYVAFATPREVMNFSSSAGDSETEVRRDAPWQALLSQDARESLNIDLAWQRVGGYALVGEVDSGIFTMHDLLRQFDEDGGYVGGNFVAATSFDTSNWPAKFDIDSDEQGLEALVPGTLCNPGPGFKYVLAPFAGHGTHTAGLLAANPSSNVRGACKHCGLAMAKVVRTFCNTGILDMEFTNDALAGAVTLLTDAGVQAISMSLGGQRQSPDYCPNAPDDAWCVALRYAAARDVVQVGASGNAKTRIQFPASDSHVIAVGGLNNALAIWDDSPSGTATCPLKPSPKECGSNFTVNLGEPRQELMAVAKSVLSTTYPGKDWNARLACGDSFGPGNGIGYCTGTSMSAPQVSGIVGILRSINPLVRTGRPEPAPGELAGIRTVLAQTTFEAQQQKGWSQTFGFGRPDAEAAAKRMLGKVEGRTVRNRVTPLFRFHGANAKDQLETSSAQMAIAFLVNQDDAYQPQGSLIPGYPALPADPNELTLATPGANAFVLTTEYSPLPRSPTLVPLFLIERSRPLPLGCTPGAQGCNKDNRDFTLLTTKPEIEAAHADGYLLWTIQGYIYAPCTPEPACIPPGAQAMYRECRLADDDCATFLESERAGYEAAGYVAAYPLGASKKMGYAYPSIDTDGDGLIDGFERVIGTRSLLTDSDGDGKSDGVEFPMAEVATGDPCGPPNGGSCPADVIFSDGFQ